MQSRCWSRFMERSPRDASAKTVVVAARILPCKVISQHTRFVGNFVSRNFKRNNPLTTVVSGLHTVERKGVEPSTSALRTQQACDASNTGKEVVEGVSLACTAACTGNAETVHGDGGDALATALLKLSPVERAKLAAMLADGNKGPRGE